MLVIDNELVVFFDVDDTLVKWSSLYWEPDDNKLQFIDPNDNSTVYLEPHKKHIELLKKYKGRGYIVIVWSAGGYQWAESVVKKLDLLSYVNIVMSKPIKYVDDLQAHEILGTRVFLEDK